MVVMQRLLDFFEHVAIESLWNLECLGERRGKRVPIPDRRKRDKGDTVAKVAGESRGKSEREAGFADATGTGERQEPDTAAKCLRLRRDVIIASDQRGQRCGQVSAARLLPGWKRRKSDR
jgi:hypothetical protein